MVRCGFGPNFAPVDEVLDIAVIMADLPQRAGPQQVTAAVASPQAATASVGINTTITVLQIMARGPISAAFALSSWLMRPRRVLTSSISKAAEGGGVTSLCAAMTRPLA